MRHIFPLILLTACMGETRAVSPPPGSLHLQISSLVPNQQGVFRVTHATPSSTVVVGVDNRSAPGPCPTVLGGTCLDLPSPTSLGSATADASGEATLVIDVPDLQVSAWFQAAQLGSTSTSNPVQVDVGPPQLQGRTVGLRAFSPSAEPGYTLFDPLTGSTTLLVDLLGREVHRWEHDEIPGSISYLTPSGTLLRASDPLLLAQPILSAGGRGGRIQELDWDGTLLWEVLIANDDLRLHHDVSRLPNGNVLAIAWERLPPATAESLGRDPANMPAQGVWPDVILELQPDGTGSADIVWEWRASDHLVQDLDPSLPHFGNPADFPERININFTQGPLRGDWMHSNALDYNAEFDQILLSVNYLDELWIIDHSTTTAEAAGSTGGTYGRGGDLLYRWGNPAAYGSGTVADKQMDGQHDTEWIPSGTPGAGDILIFNNDPAGGQSSILQLSPPRTPTGDFQWPTPAGEIAPIDILTAPTGIPFFADFISGAQRLPGGGTLITDGPTGTFIELTASGSLAWLYTNPISEGLALAQGQNAPPGARGFQNRVFRAERIAPNHPALAGRTLVPGDVLELP